jgi:hypothetical protein
MDAQSKPGPKPGRAAQIKAELAAANRALDGVRHLNDKLLHKVGFLMACKRIDAQRMEDFNKMSYLKRLWYVLHGGLV